MGLLACCWADAFNPRYFADAIHVLSIALDQDATGVIWVRHKSVRCRCCFPGSADVAVLMDSGGAGGAAAS